MLLDTREIFQKIFSYYDYQIHFISEDMWRMKIIYNLPSMLILFDEVYSLSKVILPTHNNFVFK